MTLALIVWLVMTVFPGIKFAGFMAIALIPVMGFFGMMAADCNDNYVLLNFLKTKWKYMLAVGVLALLIPSKETSWYMVGAYTTQTIAQSDTGQKLASDGVDVLQSLMKKAKEQIDGYDTKETAAKEKK